MTQAVIFVLSQHLLPDVDMCISHSLCRGYEVVKIVRDNWKQALDYLHDGTASVVVVACRNRLDPAREPRVEIAAAGGGLGPGGQPRPRLIE